MARLGLTYPFLESCPGVKHLPKGWGLTIVWRNQLGRRNLTPDQFRWFLGRKYNRDKKPAHGRGGREFWEGQNDPPKNTAQTIASENGTSEKTVKRAGNAVTKIEAGAKGGSKAQNGTLIEKGGSKGQNGTCLNTAQTIAEKEL